MLIEPAMSLWSLKHVLKMNQSSCNKCRSLKIVDRRCRNFRHPASLRKEASSLDILFMHGGIGLYGQCGMSWRKREEHFATGSRIVKSIMAVGPQGSSNISQCVNKCGIRAESLLPSDPRSFGKRFNETHRPRQHSNAS